MSKDNESNNKVKKLFQEQLKNQQGNSKNSELNTNNFKESDKQVWVKFAVLNLFFVIRVVFIYVAYFLLHKNIGIPLHFNFLDFLLIMAGMSNIIGLVKTWIKS
jgi:hypothetical protein